MSTGSQWSVGSCSGFGDDPSAAATNAGRDARGSCKGFCDDDEVQYEFGFGDECAA
jgi:hypothetical protein